MSTLSIYLKMESVLRKSREIHANFPAFLRDFGTKMQSKTTVFHLFSQSQQQQNRECNEQFAVHFLPVLTQNEPHDGQ